MVSTSLTTRFKLSKEQNPSTEKEKKDMQQVSYASVVGSLIYAMVCIRLDIAYAVGIVNRFILNLEIEHWNAIKWIMRYLWDTSYLKLYSGNEKPILVGYMDSEMAGDIDTRKSTLGYLITFVSGAVAW